ncbi:molybdopterin synthase catalytic subunit [Aliidiomarina halalkaliphila]|uniref:Molybdopterin synthase catalytic subunit n=1 Tax=Aliidiomarina halalkaliphila TaxID=2593535 RepID=A0A552X3L0_9GAMM|nr:molybdenum cofactor biosynthesis protein MoaE [Aliidiomarina halalkaliphila]TRW49628.1 molybdopterin synthase catalytic subunit [Aliidiomarina halalkaliphila]
MDCYVCVQEANFDVGAEYQTLAQDPQCGAVVTFTGLVRDLPGGGLQGIELEHYPEMTERLLLQLCERAQARWQVKAIRLIHRVGMIHLNESIVFLGVASAHRKEAFAAGEFIMDYLKTQAPFWKKELTQTGSYWVAAKASDMDAVSRWQQDD